MSFQVFRPLISGSKKISHPLSVTNFIPIISHSKRKILHPLFYMGKKTSLIPLKMAFQTWIFQKFEKGPGKIMLLLRQRQRVSMCILKIKPIFSSKIYTSQSFMLSTEYSSSTSQLDLSENWVRHDQAITGDEHRRDEFGLNNNFI